MSRVESLLERFTARGTDPAIEENQRSRSYGELAAAIATHRSLLRTKPRPAGTIGLAADHGFQSTALLLALLAERRIVTLLPPDWPGGTGLADACVECVAKVGADDVIEWEHAGAGHPHPLLQTLQEREEGGLVIFTSGTSGAPKAALHGIERFLQKFDRPGHRFRTLAFLMFDHVAGLDTMFYTLATGGTLVTLSDRRPGAVTRVLRDSHVEVLPASPSFLRLMCLGSAITGGELPSLRIITYGSEPMDPATLQLLNTRFPQARIIQKYGTTETGSPRTESRGSDSLWLRFKADPGDNDDPRFSIRDGVLWIRGDLLILGYLNVDNLLDEDGWYCTGDLVEQDGDWIRFRGRATAMINVGGEKVSPAEVEAVIQELDFVQSAIVTGEPNALMGNIVTAEVALLPGQKLPEKQLLQTIRSHCRERLAQYKVPVKISWATDSGLTPRQKLERKGTSAL